MGYTFPPTITSSRRSELKLCNTLYSDDLSWGTPKPCLPQWFSVDRPTDSAVGNRMPVGGCMHSFIRAIRPLLTLSVGVTTVLPLQPLPVLLNADTMSIYPFFYRFWTIIIIISSIQRPLVFSKKKTPDGWQNHFCKNHLCLAEEGRNKFVLALVFQSLGSHFKDKSDVKDISPSIYRIHTYRHQWYYRIPSHKKFSP